MEGFKFIEMLSVYDLFLGSGLISEEKKRDFQQFTVYDLHFYDVLRITKFIYI